MKHEYHEGPEAVEKVEEMMKRLFRAPKTVVKSADKTAKKETKTK